MPTPGLEVRRAFTRVFTALSEAIEKGAGRSHVYVPDFTDPQIGGRHIEAARAQRVIAWLNAREERYRYVWTEDDVTWLKPGEEDERS